MDLHQITPRYFVSPQISAEDVPALSEAGFTCLICNRPDSENPPSHQAKMIEAAAKAAGLVFVVNPLTHDTMTTDRLALQRHALESTEGKILAYCASGTRSTVAWVLGHTDVHTADELLTTAAKGGYDLAALRPRIEASAG